MSRALQYAIKKYNVISLIAGNHLTPLGGSAPVVLPFTMQAQVQTQWCWAATSVSVSFFYNSTSKWTQCLVANQIIGSNCCHNAAPCNKPWYLDQALAVTGNFLAQFPPLRFNQVKAQLSNGNVIGVRVGWRGGGGHFMVIHGCKTLNGVNYFSIDDPIYGKSEISETAFFNAYQGAGRWTHSFTTKS